MGERVGCYAAGVVEDGEGYSRFSVANSIHNICKTFERMNGWATKNSYDNRSVSAGFGTRCELWLGSVQKKDRA